jgi:hypothetical protein
VLPDYRTSIRGYVRGGPEDPANRTPPGSPDPRDGAGGDVNASAEDAGAAAASDHRGTPRQLQPPPDDVEFQSVMLSLERVSIMETLFQPARIGLGQAGIAECAARTAHSVAPSRAGSAA